MPPINWSRYLRLSYGSTSTQRPRRRFDAVVNLYWFCVWFLVSGPITALAAASPRRKVTIFGRRTSGPCSGRKEGPQGRKGVRKPPCVASTWNHNQPFSLPSARYVIRHRCQSLQPCYFHSNFRCITCHVFYHTAVLTVRVVA